MSITWLTSHEQFHLLNNIHIVTIFVYIALDKSYVGKFTVGEAENTGW